jgi:hypothetical protein
MRVATLLLCLTLAACAGAGGKLPGEQPVPEAAIAPAATGAPMPAPAPANAPAAGARSAARSAPAPSPAAAPGPDVLTQARVDCWMKVEHQKGLRDIDRRIAFVDKCVADAVKAQAR